MHLHIVDGSFHATVTEEWLETAQPTKAKIFMIWPFAQKVCWILIKKLQSWGDWLAQFIEWQS